MPFEKFCDLTGAALNPDLLFLFGLGQERIIQASQQFLGENFPETFEEGVTSLFGKVPVYQKQMDELFRLNKLAATTVDVTVLMSQYKHPVTGAETNLITDGAIGAALEVLGAEKPFGSNKKAKPRP